MTKECIHLIERVTKEGTAHEIAICTKCGIAFWDGIYSKSLTESWKH